ncbi:MAG: hypothetical protein GF416_04635 [Candidatus Altiarchaeales archaeon]|nr:hypothetical protein [Candidatus Altiarchaeales archaeon]MBD3416407.1 hypothetical protein [Candidatus Altiarchaeales archaeon]
MPAGNRVLNGLRLDFKGLDFGGRDPLDIAAPQLDRIPQQLRTGYLFRSDKQLISSGQEERLDVIDNHLIEDGLLRFHGYEADMQAVYIASERIKDAYSMDAVHDLILVGNGGSVSTCHALYDALMKFSTGYGRLHILDTMDPDYISYLKGACSEDETVVLAVSKSGSTQGVLDAFSQFKSYNLAAVTAKDESRPLYKMLKSFTGGAADRVSLDHPPIGGRYSGRTPSGMLPLALLGLGLEDLEKIDAGACEAYEKIGPKVAAGNNPALFLAAVLYALEGEGKNTLFAPMYSHRFDGFAHLIVQLLHESSCKSGAGQTILAASAPESQHHTNQRLFGGKQDMAVLFFTLKAPDSTGLKAGDGVPLEKALLFEYEGTREEAGERGISHVTVEVKEMTAKTVGSLLAFSHYAFGVYPALVRDVNPVDQPQVERSKQITREKRKGYTK